MKKILSQDISDSVKDYLNDLDDDYEGLYIGTVIDNKDPEKFGRCKVRVHGLHDNFSSDELPWSIPEFPLAFGVKGSFMVPEIGTVVYVKFDDGDLYEPIYSAKVLDRENLNFEADKDEDYPDSVILYETKNGDYFKINRAKGELIFKTGAGVFFKFNENGDVELTNTSSENGDMKLTLKGNFTLDDRLGDIKIISQNHSTSAYENVSVVSNGAISNKSLDGVDFQTNRDFEVVSGERIVLNARDQIRSESISNKILANTIDLLPSTSDLKTTDTDGNTSTIPLDFSVSIGNDLSKVPLLTVAPEITGGPFNVLPFDPLTGQIHGGRKVSGKILGAGFLKDDAERIAEIAKRKLQIEAKYVKLEASYSAQIAKKYASVDSQAQLILSTITGNNVLTEQKAKELKDGLASLESAKQEELNNVDTLYGQFLTSPIFGTAGNVLNGVLPTGYEKNRIVYESELKLAENVALLDPTGKSTGKNILGPGDGLFGG